MGLGNVRERVDEYKLGISNYLWYFHVDMRFELQLPNQVAILNEIMNSICGRFCSEWLFKGSLTILVWAALCPSVSACDCKIIMNLKNAQKHEFERSELIFLGKVIEMNTDGSYTLEIIELFKGDVEEPTIEGGKMVDYCSHSPFRDQRNMASLYK